MNINTSHADLYIKGMYQLSKFIAATENISTTEILKDHL